MTTVAEIQTKVAKTVVNMDRLDVFVNGDANTVVQTDNGPVDSIAGLAQNGLGIVQTFGDGTSTTTVPSLKTTYDALAGKAALADLTNGLTPRPVASTYDSAPSIILPASTPMIDIYGKTTLGDYSEKSAYRAVATQPSHLGKVQIGSQWYELLEQHATPDWFKRTGDAGDGVAMQRANDYLDAKGLTKLVMGPRLYDCRDMSVRFTTAVQWIGDIATESGIIAGVNDGNGNTGSGYGETVRGTKVLCGSTSDYSFKFDNFNTRGAFIDKLLFCQIHPAVVSGQAWTPTPYNHVLQFAVGSVEVGRVMMQGVNKGIYAAPGSGNTNSIGRVMIDRLWGQWYTEGMYIDNAQDVVRIHEMNGQAFNAGPSAIIAYMQANLRTLRLGRVDGLQGGKFFSIFHNRAISMENLGNFGTVTGGHFDHVYADVGPFGLYSDLGGAIVEITHLQTQGENVASGNGTPYAGSAGVYLTANAGSGAYNIGFHHAERFALASIYNASSSSIDLAHAPFMRYPGTSAQAFSSPGGNPTFLAKAPIAPGGFNYGAFGTDWTCLDDAQHFAYQTTTDSGNGNISVAHSFGALGPPNLREAAAFAKSDAGSALGMECIGMDGNYIYFAPRASAKINGGSDLTQYYGKEARAYLTVNRFKSGW